VNVFYSEVITEVFGTDVSLHAVYPVSGGCINTTVRLETSNGRYFMKWAANSAELFERERRGLELLRSKSPLVIPKVLADGEIAGRNFLLLEWIDKGVMSSVFWTNFGTALAEQHRQTQRTFGLDHDNHIGRLAQSNQPKADWISFFITERIRPQLQLAQRAGVISNSLVRSFELLYPKLPDILPLEPPSLLHGDLWSGNFLPTFGEYATIFDPAVYYGHREMELAFTHLFGGFDPLFYQAYEAEWPLQPGFHDRLDLYNLYPLLVHVNLFGAGYLEGIQTTLRRFVG
jgi:fructosamine-3-kinase